MLVYTTNMEQLKQIPGYKGYYANKKGEIFSAWTQGPRSRINEEKLHKRKASLSSSGYPFFPLKREDGKIIGGFVHRLVSLAFHGVPEEGMTASHLNGNKLDNRAENLVWESLLENKNRRYKHGTHDSGSNNSRSSLSEEEVISVLQLLKEGKLTHELIAKKFKVSRITITRINIGKRYKYERNNRSV